MRRVLSVRCSAERDLYRLAALLTLIVGLGQASPGSASPRLDSALLRQRSDVGVWLTNSPSPLYYSKRSIRSAMERLQRAGFTRVIPNVWSRGTTFHRSRFAPIEPPLQRAGIDIDPICTLVAEGRKRGIKVMPWFEYGLMEPADSADRSPYPSWEFPPRQDRSECRHRRPESRERHWVRRFDPALRWRRRRSC